MTNFLIGGVKNPSGPRRQLTEPWTCPECGHVNKPNHTRCMGLLDEINPVTEKHKTCCARQPGVPYLADWKSQIDS